LSLNRDMPDDPFEHRRGLTFEQAEGAAPLPAQLQLKELSQELRARLWDVVYCSFLEARDSYNIGDPWLEILRAMHVVRYHRMADEFNRNLAFQLGETKEIFLRGDYVQVFGWLQWVFQFHPYGFANDIGAALRGGWAAYRVFDRMIVPIGSDAELVTLERAFADLAASEFHGARSHLRNAATELTVGRWAGSVRESIRAVESVARVLEPSGEFSKAMVKLEASVKIHKAMKNGFKDLYGYTSDEKGIRHPLLDDGTAAADEYDALFMIGACAAFVSYMINKARAAGLLQVEHT
jgi:hypothetical protein